MTAQAPIVIVGTGLSGYSLAKAIRKEDKNVRLVMVTADDGVSYSKPMLSTGFTKGKGAEGLAQASTEAMAEQLNLELRTHTTVTGIDSEDHRLLLGDESLLYSKLVLAWGADVVRLTIPGEGQERIFPINDLADYRAFRKALTPGSRVAIMGAGLIGCEFANDLRNGDYEVEVIAPSETVMPSLLPPVAAHAVQAELESLGVHFHLGTHVERIEPAQTGVALHLANDHKIQADIVISAVGLRPRTELARASGIEAGRGITVNRALETSAKDVYALGDCAEVDGHVLLYVLPLMACARALAKTLTGERTEVSYGTMPVMIKTPCCPAAVCPPLSDAEGRWEAEQDGTHVKALFKNTEGEVLGFAVTGRFAVEKQALSKAVPPIHS